MLELVALNYIAIRNNALRVILSLLAEVCKARSLSVIVAIVIVYLALNVKFLLGVVLQQHAFRAAKYF